MFENTIIYSYFYTTLILEFIDRNIACIVNIPPVSQE